MGSSASNPDIEPFVDYATGKSFIRLHLDIEIPRDVFRDLLDLMDAEKYVEAKSMVEKYSENSKDFLELFFSRRLLSISK